MAKGRAYPEHVVRHVVDRAVQLRSATLAANEAGIPRPTVQIWVQKDPRWAETIAQKIGYHTTSMLTAPIIRRGQIRGVLQVLNKRDGAFTQRDEEFIRVLSEQIGRAIDYTTLRGDDAQRGLTVRGRFNHVIGTSVEMAAVYEMIVRAATEPEGGTGIHLEPGRALERVAQAAIARVPLGHVARPGRLALIE